MGYKTRTKIINQFDLKDSESTLENVELIIMDDEVKKYEEVLAIYRKKIMMKMAESDWYDYNEILCSAHSCAIEGNSFSVDDTRDLKEKGLGYIPQGHTLLEAYEMLDHFQAYRYMLTQVGKPLNEETLKNIHRLVTLNTLGYRTHGEGTPGEYTTVDMAAGSTIFGDHEVLIAQVPKLLTATQQQIEEGKIHPLRLAAMFHCFFEYLHPFRDGNGRTGRLMANLILLTMGHPMVIIENENKQAYLGALRFYKQERSTDAIEAFFIKTAIQRMEKELKEKELLTPNDLQGQGHIRLCFL